MNANDKECIEPNSNSQQSYKSKEDECHQKYHGILRYCLFASGKSKSVVVNLVSLKVEQMTDPCGILHSLRSYQPVSSDTVIHLETF